MIITKHIAKYLSGLKNIPLLPIILDKQIKVYTLFFSPVVFSKMIDFVRELKNTDLVDTAYHRYGGLEFRIHGKEFCHMHGDGLVDLILNTSERDKLIEKGVCEYHHVYPNSGWVSYQITKETKIEELVLLAKKALNLKL